MAKIKEAFRVVWKVLVLCLIILAFIYLGITGNTTKLLWSLIGGSVLAVAAFLIYLVLWLILPTKYFGPNRTLGVSKLLVWSGVLLFAIWLIRFAVGIYLGTNDPDLTTPEVALDSFVHALQSFSLDEDYTNYILDGKNMMRDLVGEDSPWVTVFGIYAAALNVLAPVAGGTVVFDILTSLFPRLRLRVLHLAFWRKKYYFSKLNERSLSLAGSIFRESSFLVRPVLVFTDVYPDRGSERGSELISAARLIGAVCINTDLSCIPTRFLRGQTLILIDDEELNNLTAFSALADDDRIEALRRTEVHLFVESDIYLPLEKKVFELTKERFKDNAKPRIFPTKVWQNVVKNLLLSMPLYTPLLDRTPSEDTPQTLVLTILGTGRIGTEMFLAAYWCGQMLDTELNINIVSLEDKADFCGRINFINPDILATGDPDSELLLMKTEPKRDNGKPYFHLNYIKMNVREDDFVNKLNQPIEENGTRCLLDSDYFMVALGTDEEDIAIANHLLENLGRRALEPGRRLRTVVAYAVTGAAMNDVFNTRAVHKIGNQGSEICLYAFAGMDDVYSVKNIYMKEFDQAVDRIESNYLTKKDPSSRKSQEDRIKDSYTYNSDLARAVHFGYKLYSAGVLSTAILNEDWSVKSDEYNKAIKAYKAKVVDGEHLDRAMMHRLAWLEHRRWNAYMRTGGYRATADFAQYFDLLGSHKYPELRLHPTIVECDKEGMDFDAVSGKSKLHQRTAVTIRERDRLDQVSWEIGQLALRKKEEERAKEEEAAKAKKAKLDAQPKWIRDIRERTDEKRKAEAEAKAAEAKLKDSKAEMRIAQAKAKRAEAEAREAETAAKKAAVEAKKADVAAAKAKAKQYGLLSWLRWKKLEERKKWDFTDYKQYDYPCDMFEGGALFLTEEARKEYLEQKKNKLKLLQKRSTPKQKKQKKQ